MNLEALVQKLELDATNFGRQLDNAHGLLARYERRAEIANRRASAAFRSPIVAINSLRASLASLGGALAIRQILGYADSFTQIQNSLQIAGVATENMVAVTDELFAVATRTRQPIDAISALFQRASLQTKELGISTQGLIGFIDIVGQSLAVSGTNATTARGALIQLGQALGQTAVRAEEYNSIQEGAPALLRAAAVGIDAAGGSVARLRNLIIEGQISNVEFYNGIVRGSGLIKDAFARTVPTVAQAMTNLNTALTLFVGRTDQGAGGSRALAQAINDIAAAINSPEFQQFTEDTVGGIVSGFRTMVTVISEVDEAVSGLTVAFSDFAGGTARDLENIRAAWESLKNVVRPLTAGAGPEQSIFETGDPARDLELVNQQLALALQRRQEIIDRGFTAATSLAIQRQEEFIAALETRQAELLQPPLRVDIRQAAGVEQQAGPELATGTGAATAETGKLDETIAKLEREAALLRDIGLTHDDIAAILKAESDLERQLSGAERDRLTAAIQTVGVAGTRRDLAADAADLQLEIDAQGRVTEELRVQQRLLEIKNDQGAEAAALAEDEVRAVEALRTHRDRVNQSSDLSDQLADLQLLTRYGGQESEEYRIQIALLRRKRELGDELTESQRAQVEAVERARTALQTQVREQGLREGIAGQQQQIRFAPDNALNQLIFRQDTEESRVQQRLLALRQELDVESLPAQMEALVRQSEALNTQLNLMENVAPNVAQGLAGLAEVAIFEGLDSAAEQFYRTLVQVTLQAAALKLVLGIVGAFGGGGAAAGASGIGALGQGLSADASVGGGGGFGFGSSLAVQPRQHGGPARRGHPYIVGEAGPELFIPDTSGMVVPRTATAGGGGRGGWAQAPAPQINIIDQRGAQAPPIETNVDFRGVVTATIRAEVGAMGRDGTLGQLTGTRRRGIARG